MYLQCLLDPLGQVYQNKLKPRLVSGYQVSLHVVSSFF